MVILVFDLHRRRCLPPCRILSLISILFSFNSVWVGCVWLERLLALEHLQILQVLEFLVVMWHKFFNSSINKYKEHSQKTLPKTDRE